jgi:hypothetical protein
MKTKMYELVRTVNANGDRAPRAAAARRIQRAT